MYWRNPGTSEKDTIDQVEIQSNNDVFFYIKRILQVDWLLWGQTA